MLLQSPFFDSHRCVIGKMGLEELGTAPDSFYTNKFFGMVPCLPMARLPPGGSLDTPKIKFGTDKFTRRKMGVPCLKIISTMPKIWRAVTIF